MYLHGNLQLVFDALYYLGVIDPVLAMDWNEALSEEREHAKRVQTALQVLEHCGDDLQELMDQLQTLDEETLGHLAMEVAREYAEYHGRKSMH